MGAERTGAERSRDDIDDGNGNRCRIRVGGFEGSQALQRVIGYPGVRAVVIFSDARRIGGRPEWAKRLVPFVKAPGTMIAVSRSANCSGVKASAAESHMPRIVNDDVDVAFLAYNRSMPALTEASEATTSSTALRLTPLSLEKAATAAT